MVKWVDDGSEHLFIAKISLIRTIERDDTLEGLPSAFL